MIPFRSVPDPKQRIVDHALSYFLFLIVIAALWVDDFVSLAEFCKVRRTGFPKYLILSNRFPSHDRINAVFAMTIDAMGCQKEIAQKILNKRGDYCFCVKGNQRNLHVDISKLVADRFEAKLSKRKVSRHETEEKGHGREEKRNY